MQGTAGLCCCSQPGTGTTNDRCPMPAPVCKITQFRQACPIPQTTSTCVSHARTGPCRHLMPIRRLREPDNLVNPLQTAQASLLRFFRHFCLHLSSFASLARYTWVRGGEPGHLVYQVMSRIIKFSGPAFCRHASVLLTLLLCIVFVLPLPVADCRLAGHPEEVASIGCSVEQRASTRTDAVAQNSSAKDSSVPFPCQNRPCGCRSAASCLKRCCCFSASQKSQWAKARTGSTNTHQQHTVATTHQARWRTVSFIQSMECQGLGATSFCFVIALAVADVPSPQATIPAASTLPVSDALPTASLQPPVPPPKLFT